MFVQALDHPELPPLEMPSRFKHDVAYFMVPGGERGAPKLPAGEFWIDLDEARRWLEDGVLLVYSPLDSSKQAEIALTAEQEEWLEWIVANGVNHIRVAD